MTGQTDEQGGQGRQIFMTEQEKPVSIFLPQHRPGRVVGPSRAVAAAVMATVVIMGSGLFFMMPHGNVAVATVASTDAEQSAPPREVAADAEPEVVPSESMPAETVRAAKGSAQPVETVATTVVAAAPAAEAPRAVGIPRKNDPRWARTEARNGSAALEAMRKLLVEKASTQADEGGSDLLAYAGDGTNRFSGTGVATRRPMQIVLPAELPEQPDSAARTASVKASVNMRKGPGSKHGVMMVIPRRAKVQILDCDQWCKVGYEGRTGYIYKSFVAGGSS